MKGEGEKPCFQVTAGVICRQGKVLIARRPKGSHLEGYWEFPGGKQEKGESLENCLEREIEEELGLRVRADQYLLTVNHDYGSRHISLHFFFCSLLEGEARATEGQEIKWVNSVDLKKYHFPPPDKKVIEILSIQGLPA